MFRVWPTIGDLCESSTAQSTDLPDGCGRRQVGRVERDHGALGVQGPRER